MRIVKLSWPPSFSGPRPSRCSAQDRIEVTAEPVECLPVGNNGVGWAKVDNNQPDTETRLYFRRFNDSVEDLYWVKMKPAGNGRYWGVFPKAEDVALQRHDVIEQRQNLKRENSWAEWWRAKEASDDRNPSRDLDQDVIRERASQGKLEKRDWLAEMDDDKFQSWLEQLENEPTEYFTAVHDYKGQRLAKSPTMAAEVRKNCRVELTPEQQGVADNLVVGETAYWQRDESVLPLALRRHRQPGRSLERHPRRQRLPRLRGRLVEEAGAPDPRRGGDRRPGRRRADRPVAARPGLAGASLSARGQQLPA